MASKTILNLHFFVTFLQFFYLGKRNLLTTQARWKFSPLNKQFATCNLITAMAHIHEEIDFTVAICVVHDGKILLIHHRKFDKWLPLLGRIEFPSNAAGQKSQCPHAQFFCGAAIVNRKS
jgi:hypothetical protein